MADERLARVVAELQARGVDPGELPSLQAELDALEEPPTLLRRLSQQVRAFARTQWERALGELSETQRAGELLQRRMRGEVLSPAEEATLRGQLADLVRLVPAGLIAVAIEAVPIPGSSMVTPWVLRRLGLLPSQWREAHLLEGLRREAARLRELREEAAARTVEALCRSLTVEAELRERRQAEAELLHIWDRDRDGLWDPEEREAHERALVEMVRRAPTDGARRCWFVLDGGQVYGPVPLTELVEAGGSPGIFVTHEAVDGWVGLAVLQELSGMVTEGRAPRGDE